MILSSLRLSGFKSYADHTVFGFTPGLTGIVGPHRCGKTALVEALRFVTGESSHAALRIREAADLIFSGTDRRKPMAQATVSATFSYCPEAWGLLHNQLEITRSIGRTTPESYTGNEGTLDAEALIRLLREAGIDPATLVASNPGDLDQVLGPLVLLDECDLGFSDAEIAHYAQRIDSLRPSHQLIVVTHDKRIMSLADNLWGVTMEELGVSLPVGMRLTKP